MSYPPHTTPHLPAAQPGDLGPGEHVARWLGHVAAGRVGGGARTTTAQLLRHQHNEQALLGPEAARTVRFAAQSHAR